MSLILGIAAVLAVGLGFVLGVYHDNLMIKGCFELNGPFDNFIPGGLFFAAVPLALGAIVGGAGAAREIRRSSGILAGSKQARGGIWIGALSLLLIPLVMALGLSFPFLFENPLAVTGGAEAVGTLRTVNTSEVTYASTYNTGFSETLKQLGGPPGGNSADNASLISEAAGSGNAGLVYRLTYVSHRSLSTGRIESYELYADPICPRPKHFFTDQTDVIRSTQENRRSNANDAPISG